MFLNIELAFKVRKIFIKRYEIFYFVLQKRFKRLRRIQDEESEEEQEKEADEERDAIANELFEGSGDVSLNMSDSSHSPFWRSIQKST